MYSKNVERCYGKPFQVKAVAKETGVSEENVSAVYDAIFQNISDNIMHGKTVQIPGFGNFKLKHLKSRAVYNVFTNELSGCSEEHLKISFLAYSDLQRRATRKLKRQKTIEENKKE